MGSPRIVIIGAGFSGLGMAAQLRRAGFEDFTVYEKGERVGGTWRDNRYPGLTCDVPSRFYQYSFAQKPDWTHLFSPGAEIKDYLEHFAEEEGLLPHVRFATEVSSASWDGTQWQLTLTDGSTYEADVVVTATGVLREPLMPEIAGADTFEGEAFHSARWNDDCVTTGRRVAVVGTGSTGVQIVGALAGVASKVTVFQRSRHWVMTTPNPPYPAFWNSLVARYPVLSRRGYDRWRKLLFDGLSQAVVQPGLKRRLWQAAIRIGYRLQIRDSDLRAMVTPDYEPLCKRLIASPNWFRAIQRPDVEIVADGIERIEPTGIRGTDGRLHEIDVIVYATGFDAHAFVRPMSITGTNGMTLDEAWVDGPTAYRTVAIPGFPNLFMLQGPHSPVGNYSLLSIAETQIGWIMQWLERMRRGEVASAEPTEAATAAYYSALRSAIPNTVWNAGCRSWYHAPDGTPDIWPWTAQHHKDLLAEIQSGDFHIERPAPAAAPVSA